MSLPWYRLVQHDLVLGPRPPDGLPGLRDVDHPCEDFDPGTSFGVCSSDGHYLCSECRHLDSERVLLLKLGA